jgi:hypothetical protein
VEITIAIGIALGGYFIGNGIRYGLVYFKSGKLNESEKVEGNHLYNKLIKEDSIHQWTGIPKSDAKDLIKKYPDIPHINLNGNIYYIKDGLNDWINNFNKNYK